MSRASYTARLMDTLTGSIIVVIDLYSEESAGRSVTNDAERVVQECVHAHGDHPIYYRDTEGQWDQLNHVSGKFIGFSPIRSDVIRCVVEEL